MKEFLNYLCKIWNCLSFEVINQGTIRMLKDGNEEPLYLVKKQKWFSSYYWEDVVLFEDISIDDFLEKYAGNIFYIWDDRGSKIKVPDKLEWEIIKMI